jgi:hypothetical protein
MITRNGSGFRPCALAALTLLVLTAAPAAAQETLRTESEASGFDRYTSHDNMVAFLQELRAHSADMRIERFGLTRQGRELLYAIFARPAVTRPDEALISGKPIIVLESVTASRPAASPQAVLRNFPPSKPELMPADLPPERPKGRDWNGAQNCSR